MQEKGFEPSRCFHHTDLNRARLPFRHLRELVYNSMFGMDSQD